MLIEVVQNLIWAQKFVIYTAGIYSVAVPERGAFETKQRYIFQRISNIGK